MKQINLITRISKYYVI